MYVPSNTRKTTQTSEQNQPVTGDGKIYLKRT